MASSDPKELRRVLESIEYQGDEEILEDLRAEARETVAGQREILNDVDEKASRILRLNVLLLGVAISALSIVVRLQVPEARSMLESLVNVYTRLGIVGLVLSTALAAWTYTASEMDVGLDHENVRRLLEAEFSSSEYRELLVKNYAIRITSTTARTCATSR